MTVHTESQRRLYEKCMSQVEVSHIFALLLDKASGRIKELCKQGTTSHFG